MTIEYQLFVLGQENGKMYQALKEAGVRPKRTLKQIAQNPFEAVPTLYMQCIGKKVLKPISNYLEVRFDNVTLEVPLEQISEFPLRCDLQDIVKKGMQKTESDVFEILRTLKPVLKQKQIAEKLSVTPVTITRWANGETKPSEEYLFQLEKLCYEFGVL